MKRLNFKQATKLAEKLRAKGYRAYADEIVDLYPEDVANRYENKYNLKNFRMVYSLALAARG